MSAFSPKGRLAHNLETTGVNMSSTATLRVAVAPRSTALTHALFIVGGVAFISAMAQVSIPVPGSPVPVTGQTLAALLVGTTYGARLAFSTFAGHHFKLFAASILAMAPLFAVVYFFEWESAESSLILRALRLAFVLALSGALYLLFAKLFKVAEIATLAEFGRGMLKKRKGSN